MCREGAEDETDDEWAVTAQMERCAVMAQIKHLGEI